MSSPQPPRGAFRLWSPFGRPRASPGDEDCRYVAGLIVSSTGKAIHGSLLRTRGHGLASRAEVASEASTSVPADVARTIAQLSGPLEASSVIAAVVGIPLAECQAELIERLLKSAGIASDAVDAVGLQDPGLWHYAETGPPAYMPISDAARLAEATAINVIDALAARDLACGGAGGPVAPLAEWLLLADPRRVRLLVELGRSVRMTYLPPATRGPAGILSFHVGPGTALLDLLARQLTGGAESFDSGGRLAVQGQRIGPLLEHWLAEPYFKRPLPRWHPWGVRPERFYTESVRLALEAGWSVRDLLCTATHFIAETIALALERLPAVPPWEQVVVCGGGQQNGLLLREIGARIAPARVIRSSELGISPHSVGAAATAMLARLCLDQEPANLPGVTGARHARVLGRLTVATPASWRRIVRLAETDPDWPSRKSA